MVQGNKDQDKRSSNAPPLSEFEPPYPFRHKNYLKSFHAIENSLQQTNALILQGAERTGKSTLISEIRQKYEQQGVEVISFNSAVNTPRQLYCLLADALNVPKLKKDLVAALQKSKAAGDYCLVILDESAVNSSAAVSEALRKLCDPKAKTAGAIKVIVVCADYLVIHTKTTYETDFHDWVETIVPMHAIRPEELEGLAHYLAGLKNCPSPYFETGADLELIERSNGKIDRLIDLINPLIDESVISDSRFKPADEGLHPLDSKRSKYYFLGAAAILVFLLGVGMRSIIIPSIEEKQEDTLSENAEVFKEGPTNGSQRQKNQINPPVLDKRQAQGDVNLVSNTFSGNGTEASETLNINSPEVKLPLAKIPSLVDGWIQAQKDKNTTAYFRYYKRDFSTKTTSNKSWRSNTVRSFNTEQLLKLQRGDLEINVIGNSEAKVEFWLNQINSKGSQLRIKKRLILSHVDKSWLIKNELNSQVVKK